jgi:hypothetical protein
MGRHRSTSRAAGAALMLLGIANAACESSVSRSAPSATGNHTPRPPGVRPRASGSGRPVPSPSPSGKPAPAVEAPPVSEPGRADLDPDNDELVAPPEPIGDCETRLETAKVRFKTATLPLRQPRRGTYTCGAPQVVLYEQGPTELRWNAPPLVTCGMALALANFEELLQTQAQAVLGSRVVRARQGGTYSCRKMTRFSTMVSEHSYANAIDVYSFKLADGREISVKSDFGPLDREPEKAQGKFLRALARAAFDQRLFSVVLTPFFDRLHSDHLHVDLARYRVDGSR